MVPSEIVFEVTEAEEGGYSAHALGFSIFTEGDTMEQLCHNVVEATDCYFDETVGSPKIIRLRFGLNEVLVR